MNILVLKFVTPSSNYWLSRKAAKTAHFRQNNTTQGYPLTHTNTTTSTELNTEGIEHVTALT